MRDIKFRIWNGWKMEYDIVAGRFGIFYVNPGSKGDGLDPNDSASLTNANTKYSNTTPVMQYTGLKDKNGKDIYEGDIVRAYKPNSYLEGIYEVRWHDNEGAWRYWKECGPYFMFSVQSKMYNIGNNKGGAWCEVIGNIYENPDLLNP